MRSKIVIGCDQLGGSDWGNVCIKDSINAIDYAVCNGFYKFDTSDVYGLGASEARLSCLLNKHRSRVFLTSKVGVRWNYNSGEVRAKTQIDNSRKYLIKAIEMSLARLDKFDNLSLLLHWPKNLEGINNAITIFKDYQKKGLIKNFGICNAEHHIISNTNLAKSLKNNIFQYRHSIIDHIDKDLIEILSKNEIKTMAYGIFAQGVLANSEKFNQEIPENDRRARLEYYQVDNLIKIRKIMKIITEICFNYQTTQPIFILSLTLKTFKENEIIVGISQKKHVDDLIAALNLDIKKSDIDYCLSLFKKFY